MTNDQREFAVHYRLQLYFCTTAAVSRYKLYIMGVGGVSNTWRYKYVHGVTLCTPRPIIMSYTYTIERPSAKCENWTMNDCPLLATFEISFIVYLVYWKGQKELELCAPNAMQPYKGLRSSRLLVRRIHSGRKIVTHKKQFQFHAGYMYL
jgi:hypothetical protein